MEYIDNLDDYEIVLPNLEFFYRINKKILEKLIFTLKRLVWLEMYIHIFILMYLCILGITC